MARHGDSRDSGGDRAQLVIGRLCAADGCPVGAAVFAGNTADPATGASPIAKLKQRLRLRHVVLAGERGMITAARIAQTLRPAGLDWLRGGAVRCLKTVDLALRPVCHATAPRVRAHGLLCRLASYWEWHMRQPLALGLFDDPDRATAAAEQAAPVAKAKVSKAAWRTASTQPIDAGDGSVQPAHGCRTRLNDLAPLTRNLVGFAGQTMLTVPATPTPVQRRAFSLLGIEVTAASTAPHVGLASYQWLVTKSGNVRASLESCLRRSTHSAAKAGDQQLTENTEGGKPLSGRPGAEVCQIWRTPDPRHSYPIAGKRGRHAATICRLKRILQTKPAYRACTVGRPAVDAYSDRFNGEHTAAWQGSTCASGLYGEPVMWPQLAMLTSTAMGASLSQPGETMHENAFRSRRQRLYPA